MYLSATIHGEKPNLQISASTAMGSMVIGHVTVAIPDTEISAVRFCSYTVRRTQYDRPS